MPGGHEILQEVTVIAGQLDDLAGRPQIEPRDHLLDILPRPESQLSEYEEK